MRGLFANTYCRLLAIFALSLPTLCLAEITVIDSAGREVTIPSPASRIVALAPHIVELVYSAGAGEQLAGVVSYSNYPGAAQSLPQVGSAFSWSLESVVAMEPDLVVLWESGNGINALSRLEALGLTVYVSEPRQLADISDNIRDLGALAGTGELATRQARKFDTEINTLREQYQAKSPVRVFYQIWNSPLQTINQQHMINQVITLCGGRNIFANAPQLAPQISLEAVLVENPDAIVASGMDISRPEWLDDWKQYASLKAVQSNTLFHIHPDLLQRPTARITQGAKSMCQQLDTARQRFQ